MSHSFADRLSAKKRANTPWLDASYVAAAAACLDQLKADGVETLRFVFPDQHGLLRGKTVLTDAAVSAFTGGLGLPSTLLLKDTAHKTVFPVWDGDVSLGATGLNGAQDVIAVPDPGTVTMLPWSPQSRIVLCDLYDRSGAAINIAPRAILRRAMNALSEAGFAALMGLEVEFQVFERLNDGRVHADATMPPAAIETQNLTQGWQYLTDARYGATEELWDELRRACGAMALGLRTIEIEMGPSQFEFTFEPADPMTQANRFVFFRTMVKELCHRRGLHASFMAKPRLPNAAANGWHIHQSLTEVTTGHPVFMPTDGQTLTPQADGWIAGLLEHAAAACLLTTPTINGYKRYGPFQLAPNRVAWGRDNRGAMIRALMYPGDGASRIENRVADTTANPYFAFAAQLLSGLDGIHRTAHAPPETNTPYASEFPVLPASLIDAVEAFDQSAFFRAAMGDTFVDYLCHIKRAEWARYIGTVSEWEQAEYFNMF